MTSARDRATLELIGIPLDGRSRHWAPEPATGGHSAGPGAEVERLRQALAASRAQVAALQTQLVETRARERELIRVVQGRMLEAQRPVKASAVGSHSD